MKKIIAVLLLCCFRLTSNAFDYTYIYIQGDNETPFYVRLEGEMLPRLGKNYCIIPNLDAGDIHISILFTQNKYPQQDFTIRVPADRPRGFVLRKVSEEQFSLQDLATQQYITAGNRADESDIATGGSIPPFNNNDAIAATVSPAAGTTDTGIPDFKPSGSAKKKTGSKTTGSSEAEETERFLDEIELSGENRRRDEPTRSKPSKPKRESTIPAGNTGKVVEDSVSDDNTIFMPTERRTGNDNAVIIPNTDCPSAMSNDQFESFAVSFLDKADDENRLKFIQKKGMSNCYTSEQIRILANSLESQSARYELVKKLYPKAVDQENYKIVEPLFTSSFLKKKFAELVQK